MIRDQEVPIASGESLPNSAEGNAVLVAEVADLSQT